jgi:uncharacterized protein
MPHRPGTRIIDFTQMHNDWPFNPTQERYVSVATYRQAGVEVATPVWMAESNGRYYVFSEGNSGKVKRLRLNERARLASCDFRGKVNSEWLASKGRVVTDAATVARANQALHRKYGWQMVLGNLLSKLSGRFAKRAIIEFEIIE